MIVDTIIHKDKIRDIWSGFQKYEYFWGEGTRGELLLNRWRSNR